MSETHLYLIGIQIAQAVLVWWLASRRYLDLVAEAERLRAVADRDRDMAECELAYYRQRVRQCADRMTLIAAEPDRLAELLLEYEQAADAAGHPDLSREEAAA